MERQINFGTRSWNIGCQVIPFLTKNSGSSTELGLTVTPTRDSRENCNWSAWCLPEWSAGNGCNEKIYAWWRHQMESFSALLVLSPVTGIFPPQRPVTRSFGVFFDLRLNKGLNKQSRRRWFEMPSLSLWRHCNSIIFHRVEISPGSQL